MRGAWFLCLGVVLACEQRVYLDDRVCAGRHGPASVRVDGVCIDSTEVTVGDYQAFLMDAPQATTQPAECSWKTSFVPDEWPQPPGNTRYPVGNVDWCDASAFCVWAGKRLCGRVGGGPVSLQERTNTATNEWFRACSHDGAHEYPYGDVFSAPSCAVSGPVVATATLGSCMGGYAGIFDLVGNVWEWTNACEAADTMTAAASQCDRRGGAVSVLSGEASCATGELIRRNLRQADTGFRCCSD